MDQRDDMLEEPHVAPLMELVHALRARGFHTPNFDPNDGGINSTALFLLDCPGSAAAQTNYLSQDNPEQSARNLRATLQETGFNRSDIVIWSIVPYWGSSTSPIRGASAAQIAAAVPDAQDVLDRLPHLKAIIFCGQRAQRAKPRLRLPNNAAAYLTFHPGPQAYNHEPYRAHIWQAFRAAHDRIAS